MFKSAKIKLTAWYLVIIMAVTISFTSFVYFGVMNTTQHALDAQRHREEERMELMFTPDGIGEVVRPPIFLPDEQTISEIREKTLLILLLINLVVLVTAGTLGYVLAGITLRPIEEMIKKQKRFISDAAHEMRTPLTAMKTGLEVTLRDKNLNVDESKKTLESTIDDVNGLTNFMNRLLEQSKYQNGNEIMEKKEVALDEIIKEVVKKLEPTASKKNEILETDLHTIKISGNKHGLTELFMNLIDNAIKYNKQGEKVEISLRKEDGHAVFKVTDHGVGIAENELRNIFEPFYRADKSRAKIDHDGFGLGLTIAKEIVDKHKGKIYTESIVNVGTTFIVKLPVISNLSV